MSIRHLNNAFKLIDDYKGQSYYFEGEKSDERVVKAEVMLGATFPPTYRKFLQKYGSGGLEGMEINGIIDDKFDYWCTSDCVGITLNERQTSNAPSNFIIIATSGFGPYYVLDSSQPDKRGEYPVLLWMPGSPETPTEKIANDFGEFLLEQVKQALEIDNDTSA